MWQRLAGRRGWRLPDSGSAGSSPPAPTLLELRFPQVRSLRGTGSSPSAGGSFLEWPLTRDNSTDLTLSLEERAVELPSLACVSSACNREDKAACQLLQMYSSLSMLLYWVLHAWMPCQVLNSECICG